jgi:D-alanyl-D-alanine carboxypeptidase/D-alanyl-D-alanine-endopeptidase (penicillin-binding protein 4)
MLINRIKKLNWTHRIFFISVLALFSSCSVQKQLQTVAEKEVLQTEALRAAHVGISIYDPSANTYIYNYEGDKYFVPASNTKLFSLYAGMKYLGDSLVGIRYIERDTAILILPSGDPTLLHPDFARQPVIDFLKNKNRHLYVSDAGWKEQALGAGWSWDDYNDDYMPERSPLPVYGNTIKWIQAKQAQEKQDSQFDATPSVYSVPEVDWKVRFNTESTSGKFFVKRKKDENIFEITEGTEKYKVQEIPFVTNGLESALILLKDTLGKEVYPLKGMPTYDPRLPKVVHSRPVDSLFRPMMYRSDNFFAEQTLLMVSNERLGIMNDEKIIDTLLKTDFRGLPQKPGWVDGSGLSRFNLFTPQDFVWLLNAMKNEFGLERMKTILPTGGTGTLGRYYKQDSGYIYAKTGSLSGVICLSGYLLTKKNKLLIFSVLVNNHRGSVSAIRTEVAAFLYYIRKTY